MDQVSNKALLALALVAIVLSLSGSYIVAQSYHAVSPGATQSPNEATLTLTVTNDTAQPDSITRQEPT